MRFADIVDTSNKVADSSARRDKIASLAGLLERLRPNEIPAAVAYLSGELRQGRIGIGPAAIRDAAPGTAASRPELELEEVDAALARIASLSGAGSARERVRRLRELLARSTRREQGFLSSLLMGDLRQGALAGVMVEAVARAAKLPTASVRRALMFSGDLGEIAVAALTHGREGLRRFSLQLFRPVQPMLAQTADEVEEALEGLDVATLEYKLDGARVQVHRAGDEVRVYTRRLNDVTPAVPELVERVAALPVREIVLDGEALALRSDGRPHPFQQTMRRFGRKLDVERMRRELPLQGFYFDCLLLDGEELIDRPAAERLEALGQALPAELAIPRAVAGQLSEAQGFLEAALAVGHEGIMVKALDAPYEAGRRGSSWLKVKPTHTLDLVVLAAEWGSGRRRGWLSNLHLGARDPESGGYVMLGKTFKGMTDEMLEWQTHRLQELEIGRDEWIVYVRPELVVEIAFKEIQESPRYPAGLALRFARVKRYRPDKPADGADTVQSVRAIYEASAQSR